MPDAGETPYREYVGALRQSHMTLRDALRSIFNEREVPPLLEARAVDGFPQFIVGESRYLDSFVQIFGQRTENGVDR